MISNYKLFKSFLFGCALIFSCKSDPKVAAQGISEDLPQFLDSIQASHAIVEKDEDGMLDNMTMLDISIQMKMAEGFDNVDEARIAYKEFLRTQVADFEPEEKAYMIEVFTTVNEKLKKLNPDLIFPTLKLAKIKLDHYGADVYYTRGDVIMLPANSLKGRSPKGQINVMLHEVWHILSRYNDNLRDEAYRLIGFENLGQNARIIPPLAEKILMNPDGVRMDYVIDLGDGIKALPIVKSSRNEFSASNPNFFNYIQFDLYVVNEEGVVVTNEQGGSTLPAKNNSVFFEKIKDNTQYIIHPDEIIADNFMLAVNAYDLNEYDQFSKPGSKLVQDLIQLLIKHKQ